MLENNGFPTKDNLRPSFLEGISRMADLGGLLNDHYKDVFLEGFDFSSLISDWETLSDDFREALAKVLLSNSGE